MAMMAKAGGGASGVLKGIGALTAAGNAYLRGRNCTQCARAAQLTSRRRSHQVQQSGQTRSMCSPLLLHKGVLSSVVGAGSLQP